jgi:hypothetical protein
MNMAYTDTDYAQERAILDKAQAYWNANATFNRNGSSSMSAELCANPVYAVATNDMRGRVERYEFMRDLPASYVAYANGDMTRITTWNGEELGTLRITNNWRSNFGDKRYSGRAVIGGATYSVLAFGGGMYCRLRKMKGN